MCSGKMPESCHFSLTVPKRYLYFKAPTSIQFGVNTDACSEKAIGKIKPHARNYTRMSDSERAELWKNQVLEIVLLANS
jgi:hypothetical protein